MTQHELVIKYIEQKGSILPAKMAGSVFLGEMFGSETSKRCRELRKKGLLRGEREGKFERFFLNDSPSAPKVRMMKVEGMDKFVPVILKA